MKKRIIILDDEPLIPDLIKDLISEDPDFEIAAVASSVIEFLEKISQEEFALALVDVSIGKTGKGGLELLSTLRAQGINLPVIMLSAHDESEYAPTALKEGARGYINKMHIITDLLKGARAVAEGGLFVSGPDGSYLVAKSQK